MTGYSIRCIAGLSAAALLGASTAAAQVVYLNRPERAGLPPRGLAVGLAATGNVNFSVQACPAPGARFQKNSYAFPTGELLASYTGSRGWRLESGLGLGSVAAVTLDAREPFGRSATVSFGTAQVPLRLYRYLTFNPRSRLSLSPHAGLQAVFLSMGEKVSARHPIYAGRPDYGSQSSYFRTVRERTLTYQVGAGLHYVAARLELTAFVRYTNSFGNPVVAEGRWDYDVRGQQQPALYAASRLENLALGIAVRRTIVAR
ncbi:hypothetical protein KLP40_19730 [Hymenobacter sp. NST-14]|uniref:hypothetical protein n=1 Tax=Hymenobacter piscis TaxID=2839984 RepID=UPI001C0232B0|nr:hypothetical protein [Hymenobacter piscis]MBT9395406.1 hypothetical protein [Hymenobacter piscis]